MTYKQIEMSREARLWIGQIIIPTVSVAVTILAIPEVRQAIATKMRTLKKKMKKMKKF